MNAYRFLDVPHEGPVLIVTIDRPDVLNALHAPAHVECSAVFDRFASDPGLRVAILTGAGSRAFCAGNDLKYQAQGDAADPDRSASRCRRRLAAGLRLGACREWRRTPSALLLATEIASCSSAAIRAAKQVALRGAESALSNALKLQGGWPEVKAMRSSPDYVEGPRAFAEKRPPRWSNG